MQESGNLEPVGLPPKIDPREMLDLDEGLGTDVAKRKSFWSVMALEKHLVPEQEDMGSLMLAVSGRKTAQRI